jgi:hypothetical protein
MREVGTGHPPIREELMTVVVLGLILLAAAGVLTAAVVTSNTSAVDIDLWSVQISNLSTGGVFVAGMLTTLVGVAGLVLLMIGYRRTRRLQHERRVLRRENQRLVQRAETAPADEPVTAEPQAETDETPRRRPFFSRRRNGSTDAEDRWAEHEGDRVTR